MGWWKVRGNVILIIIALIALLYYMCERYTFKVAMLAWVYSLLTVAGVFLALWEGGII